MSTSVRVRVVADPRAHPEDVVLPEAALPPLGLIPHQQVKLKAGQRAVAARIRPRRSPPPTSQAKGIPLGLHPSTMARLLLPGEGLQGYLKVDDHTLHIGPFVGIFALRALGRHLFGEPELYFRYLSAFGRRLYVPTYVFSARDVDWSRRLVRGFLWVNRRGASGWRRMPLPLPDVVYDRLASRRAAARASVRSTAQRLMELPGVVYFNPGFFSKWFIYTRLSQVPEIQPYLPETSRLLHPAAVRQFLLRHRTVFIKPSHGSQGLGIIVIRRRSRGYDWVWCTRSGYLRRRLSGLDPVIKRLGKIIGRHGYIMQQGIRLARWKGRRFDIRILMQKDRGGHWQQTKIYARVAPAGGLTSNLSGGGEAKHLPTVLRGAFGSWEGRRLYREIQEVSRSLTPLIEAQIGGTVGELGLDLAVDRRGRIWIIEVNSKPFVQMTPGSGSRKAIRLSAIRPLRWARFAAGFEPGSSPPQTAAPGLSGLDSSPQVAVSDDEGEIARAGSG